VAKIDPYDFLAHLRGCGLSFYSGVPDSLLSGLCSAIEGSILPTHHVTAPNEGVAVALGVGSYLATGQPPVIYLQNAGLGNVVNPIVSLASPVIYGIPMLLVVGWRAEVLADTKQLADEPQHQLQGRITLSQLEIMGVPFEVLGADAADWKGRVSRLIERLRAESTPAALVVRKNTFSVPSRPKEAAQDRAQMTREQAIACCLNVAPHATPVVATTGMAARELFELRKHRGQGHERDFLCIGAMGLASQVAVGMARAQPSRRVLCIDGDGALLMHMGGMPLSAATKNLVHVVINNRAHESVGGYATSAPDVRLATLAQSCGYAIARRVSTLADLEDALKASFQGFNSAFIEVRCAPGHRADLGRPTVSPADGKDALMKFIGR
jgi:phosphonopyruvate decarboxylase